MGIMIGVAVAAVVLAYHYHLGGKMKAIAKAEAEKAVANLKARL